MYRNATPILIWQVEIMGVPSEQLQTYNIQSLNQVQRESECIIMVPCKYKKRLLLRYIHNFKSDVNNNMDYMRFSGTELSSVILSQQCDIKGLNVISQMCQKQVKAKRDSVINPQNYNFNQF